MKTATSKRTKTVRSSRRPATLDLAAAFASEYVAPKRPVLLETLPGRYLFVTGTGAPGGAEFQACIGALYSVAFTVKMTRKFGGLPDYTISKLEARYPGLDATPFPPRDEWTWELLIRTPEFVEPAELTAAVSVLRKRGKEGDAARVRLETIHEGRCVQMLHVGPYDKECDTLAAMAEFAKAQGLRLVGPHHEIYISDPRRVAPEKLKTLLRVPVAPAAGK